MRKLSDCARKKPGGLNIKYLPTATIILTTRGKLKELEIALGS
jgi:hypothetical protein